jgi:Zn-dependent M28 family amino/carboxypeptidase
MARFVIRFGVSLLVFATLVLGADSDSESLAVQSALTRITANSLRGHLSYLSSDLLEGRGTPSRGQDLAAEYIAAQFRRAGLETPGPDGYFQNAPFLSVQPNRDQLRFEIDGRALTGAEMPSIENSAEVSLKDTEAIKWAAGQDAAGKVVFVHADAFPDVMRTRRQLADSKAALIVIAGPAAKRFRSRTNLIPADQVRNSIPVIAITDEALTKTIEAAPAGPLPMRVAVHIAAPSETAVKLRNVVGVLRGSDPVLKDTYEIVTAHYDHLGVKADGEGDRIYNGANDDGSGTVSIIEIASALASMNPRPHRSIVFMAFFGEELGLLGSRYYGSHPVVPLLQTVADLNLEHMGRTDSNLGTHVKMVNVTGFDFSNITSTLKKAGDLTGIQVIKDEANSDPFFARSDNQALADIGVPAHTISVSYEFPDYHQVGDEWEKVDYDNMAQVDRMVALALVMIADNPAPPSWNESNPKAKKYVDAWRKTHPPMQSN